MIFSCTSVWLCVCICNKLHSSLSVFLNLCICIWFLYSRATCGFGNQLSPAEPLILAPNRALGGRPWIRARVNVHRSSKLCICQNVPSYLSQLCFCNCILFVWSASNCKSLYIYWTLCGPLASEKYLYYELSSNFSEILHAPLRVGQLWIIKDQGGHVASGSERYRCESTAPWNFRVSNSDIFPWNHPFD